jgi:tripartite-type tricarboxylate transporter receptor subunit TctC
MTAMNLSHYMRICAHKLLVGCAIGAGLYVATLSPTSAQSGSYPNRPIKIVVGFPAGGASDVAGRAIGQKMSVRLGQPVVIENRAGAASNIGSEAVARAAPDGYTVLFGTISLSINPSLYPKLAYDPLKDLVPVSMISSAPFLLVVNPSSPIKSVRELIAASKTSDLNYATAGNGSGSHLFTELFRSEANIKLTHVPYRGAAPAMNDVLSGQVPLTFDNIITTLPLVQAGKLRALAVSTKTRSKAAPDIPTMHESGVPGFDATSWFGFFVPTGTPREIVARLNEETLEALKDPEVRDRLLKLGAEPMGSSPEEFGHFFRNEVARWGKVVREAKVQID